MTFGQRVKAVAAHGFTDRQARFLVTVLLHSGVCMDRHYCAFAGIAHGQKTTDFFRSLVGRKLATAYVCAHRRARTSTSIIEPSTRRSASLTAAFESQRPSVRPSNA